MVEVFRTDVNEAEHARILLLEIKQRFNQYEVNFDLEDCDRILRVKSCTGLVDVPGLIGLFKGYGYTAEILPDVDLQAAPSVAFPFFNLFNIIQS